MSASNSASDDGAAAVQQGPDGVLGIPEARRDHEASDENGSDPPPAQDRNRRRNRQRRRIHAPQEDLQDVNGAAAPGNQGAQGGNVITGEMFETLRQELINMRQDIQRNQELAAVTQRSLAQLQNDVVQYRRPGAEQPPFRDGDELRRRLIENDPRRRLQQPEARQSIRLIRETSRINNLQFEGNVVKCNPRNLIRNFEENADIEGLSEREKTTAFAGVLKGEAAQWAETIEIRNYQDLKREFLRKYWSERVQRKVVEYILDGRYDAKSESGREAYFRKWASLAKSLDQEREDAWIIDRLKFHFNERIQDKFEAREPRTITEAANILLRLDKPNFGVEQHNRRTERGNDDKPAPVQDNPPRNRFKEYSNNQAANGRQNGKGGEWRRNRNEGNPTRNNAKVRVIQEDDWSDVESGTEEDSLSEDNTYAPDEDHGKQDDQGKEICTLTTPSDEEQSTSTNTVERKTKICPVISILIFNQEELALLDTGAEVSAVSEQFVKERELKGRRFRDLPAPITFIKGALGDKMKINRQILLEFNINQKEIWQPCVVVKKLTNPIILGFDFILQQGVIIDPITQSARLDKLGESTQLQTTEGRLCALHGLVEEDPPQEDRNREIEELKQEFAKVFEDKTGKMVGYKHKIKLRNAAPFKGKSYPIPQAYRDQIQKQIDQLVEQKIIKRAATEYINPIVVVKKKNGDLRMCLDARNINARMEADHAQPPNVEEILCKIDDAKWFAQLDINKAFWTMELEEESQQYTGFLFGSQTYVHLRVPFGIKTAGGSFTRGLGQILGPKLERCIILFLDDILIFEKTWKRLMLLVREVLTKLHKGGLTVNKEKSRIGVTEVKFLGHVINEFKIKMTEETKQTIIDFPTPKGKKQLQAFLGLANWDRKFIPALSEQTRPLETLLQKEKKFRWESPQEEAFRQIKRSFKEAEDLFLMKKNPQLGIETDASKLALGARLYQKNPETQALETVAYSSRSLKPREQQYTVTEMEGLAVVWALHKWHIWLAERPITVKTDHKALTFIQTCALTNNRLARWILAIQHYNIDWQHVEGKDNKYADYLSRYTKEATEAQPSSSEIKIRETTVHAEEDKWRKLRKRIVEEQRKDEWLSRNLDKLQIKRDSDGLIRILDDNTWKTLLPTTIAKQVAEEIHQWIMHFGTDKLYHFLQHNFIMKNAYELSREIAACCDHCQKTKYYTKPTEGRQYFKNPTDVRQIVSVDIFGPLPTTRLGNKYIIVLQDLFSKLTRLLPIRRITAQVVCSTIEKKFIAVDGKPKTFLTDQATQFTGKVWKNLGERIGCEIRTTSPYNPQSNPVERVMREVGRALRSSCAHKHTTWDQPLKKLQLCLNSLQHRSTQASPAAIEGIPELQVPSGLGKITHSGPSKSISKQQVHKNLTAAAEKRNSIHQKKKQTRSYEEGQWVLKRVHKLSNKVHKFSSKLHQLYDGPYKIIQIPHENAYTLERKDGKNMGTHNARQLRPYRSPNQQLAARINHNTVYGAISTQSPMLDIRIEDSTLQALIDTGATRSSVAAATLMELEAEGYEITKWVTPNKKIQGITGKLISSRWESRLKFWIKDNYFCQDCMVISGAHSPLVLGMDFITEYGLIIDATKQSIRITNFLTYTADDAPSDSTPDPSPSQVQTAPVHLAQQPSEGEAINRPKKEDIPQKQSDLQPVTHSKSIKMEAKIKNMCLKARRAELRLYQALKNYKNALKEKRRDIKNRLSQLKEGFGDEQEQTLLQEAPLNARAPHYENISPPASPRNNVIAPPNTPAEQNPIAEDNIEVEHGPERAPLTMAEPTAPAPVVSDSHLGAPDLVAPQNLTVRHRESQVVAYQHLNAEITLQGEIAPVQQQPEQNQEGSQVIGSDQLIFPQPGTSQAAINAVAFAPEAISLTADALENDPHLCNFIQLAWDGAEIAFSDEQWAAQYPNQWPEVQDIQLGEPWQATVQSSSAIEPHPSHEQTDSIGHCSTHKKEEVINTSNSGKSKAVMKTVQYLRPNAFILPHWRRDRAGKIIKNSGKQKAMSISNRVLRRKQRAAIIAEIRKFIPNFNGAGLTVEQLALRYLTEGGTILSTDSEDHQDQSESADEFQEDDETYTPA